MNKSKSYSSLNLSRQSSCSDIEQVSLGNLSEEPNAPPNTSLQVSEECPNFVRQSESKTHRHFELLNSQQKGVMKLKFKKELKVRIKSNCVKRDELDHIQKQLMTFNRIPDWGYGQCDQPYGDGLTNWETLLELVQNRQKYELAENEICKLHVEDKMEKDEMLVQMKIQALKKRITKTVETKIKTVFVGNTKPKTKHEKLLEGLEKLNQEQMQAINYLKMHQIYHQKRKEAEQNRQNSSEKKCKQKKCWFEKPSNCPNSIQAQNQTDTKTETPQKLKLKPCKIIVRKSAPQVIQLRILKLKKMQKPQEDQEEEKVVSKFVKSYRKSLTAINIDDIITSASNSTFNRTFGNSVQPNSFRNFSDVNQQTFYQEVKSEEEEDCPFDIAIEDIEVEEKEESHLKITRQQSSDTILEHQAFRTKMSRNDDKDRIKIKHIKRNSLQIKPFQPEELFKIYDPKPQSSAMLSSSKSRHSTKPSTTGSVKSKLKQIIRNKAKQTQNFQQLIYNQQPEGVIPRFSQPLPFTFTPRHSGGRMMLEEYEKKEFLPFLNNKTEMTTLRKQEKSKLVVPMCKINFIGGDNTGYLSSRR